jgi:hypothetical protein
MTTPNDEWESGDMRTLLGELRQSDRRLSAPPRVEETVLAAWDSRDAEQVPITSTGPSWRTWGWMAAAASLVLAVAVVPSRVTPLPATDAASTVNGVTGTDAPTESALEWLDPDPASLQVVHLRVASDTLQAQGLAVSDPDGDGLVDIEMIVGVDGMARSVRVASAE